MRISNYPTDTLTGTELILATDVNTSTQEYKTVNFSVDTLKTFLVGTDDTNEFTNITLGGSLKFEGATADAHETTLGVINPTADRAINLPNVAGTLPVLAEVSATAITSTPEELNYVDGVTSNVQTQFNNITSKFDASATLAAGYVAIVNGSGKISTTTTAYTPVTASELDVLSGVVSTLTAAELNILDGVTTTTAELNLLDGGTSVGSSITVADADGIIINDGGTMKSIPASDIKTFVGSIPHKIAGTDFGNSVIVGHSTTGTLNGATGNTGLGFKVLEAITEGDNNTAIGYGAGDAITTGDYHTAVGAGSMGAITGGEKCVAIGYNALASTTAPNQVVAVGESALYSYNISNNSQGFTVAIGARAGYAIAGVNQPYATLIGYGAGDSITTGVKNTIVGASADVANATDENSIVIGAFGAGHGSNIAVIGNTDTTAWHPADDNGVDLGSASYSFKDAFVQGVVNTGGVKMGGAVADPARVDLHLAQAITHNDHKGTLLFDGPDAGIADGALSEAITFNNTAIDAEANVIIQMKSDICADVIVYNIADNSCKFKILNKSGNSIVDGDDIDLVYTVINQN